MTYTNIPYDDLKFKAEIIRTGALLMGSPFGTFIIQTLTTGIVLNWYLLIKIPIVIISLVSCLILLQVSYNIMQVRERLIKNNIKRINQWMNY